MATSSSAISLLKAIETTSAAVGVVGMGYVGFPLACAVDRAGYQTCGFDVDPIKIERLFAGKTYLGHMTDEPFAALAGSDRFSATSNVSDLSVCDVIILCVPTPLGEENEPDLSYVIQSTKSVASILRPGMLIVLESTTWPGTTREVMLPILEGGGLVCGEDFFLAYSPERVNPADAKFETASIPKVVGGIGDDALRLASEFYGRVVCDVVPVASAEIAEASKIVENIYRCVNIALVNELKLAFDKMGIDVWDVIKASATKPFGFQPFWPGPGLGGHCIPIDPFYLSWRARQCGAEARFIELAGEINTSMPSIVVERTCDELGTAAGKSVLVIGVSYKPNVSDIRETPAAPIIEMLQERGCDVSYHDPHCPEFPAMKRHTIDLQSVPLDEANVSAADVVLIVTDHAVIDWSMLGNYAKVVVDTRNAMDGIAATGRIVKA
ncbi:MAG: nucleotide sugar dehydrogenase [Phycisphaerales bacterium]|nr:nucleotide sugar dehydrogenase [Phycisphaerales bacterium]